MCNSTCFSHSQHGNSPIGFQINPQGKCKVFGWAEEFCREHSLSHFPFRLIAEKGFLEKAPDKEAYNFVNVLNEQTEDAQ